MPVGLSVPYPALTGLLAGVAGLIPIIGMKVAYVPMALYLAVAGVGSGEWWFVVFFFAVTFVIVDTIPDLVIRPYVSGGGSLSVSPFGGSDPAPERESDAGLHTGTLMLAHILGPFLFGWYGRFLAPRILVLVVHFARIVLSVIVNGEPHPGSVDPTNLVGEEVGDPERDGVPERGSTADSVSKPSFEDLS